MAEFKAHGPGKHVQVPLWIWTLLWVLELVGADNWLQAIGALLMLWTALIVYRSE